MGIDEKLLVIRKNDFLSKLTQEEYDSLNVIHNYVLADKNNYIYFDPQSLNRLYFIKEGYVKLGYIDDAGNDIVKDILKQGDVFGQFTLEPENKYGEYALAYKTDVALCTFTITDFKELLQRRPDMSIEYAKKVGNQLRRLEYRLMNLLQKDVRSRLLYFFWTLFEHHAHKAGETNLTIANYFTHIDIARLTGISRQTTTTLINQFEDEKLIHFDKRQIIINDIQLLKKELNVG
ncbi:MAG: Crp/Fnr family transcriptional regulator [Bacteroidetes bacterium]|nr:Crp/Fnr family transcriptional regulator [Bacteroidota bacterium]